MVGGDADPHKFLPHLAPELKSLGTLEHGSNLIERIFTDFSKENTKPVSPLYPLRIMLYPRKSAASVSSVF
jgi:hypothetical protein